MCASIFWSLKHHSNLRTISDTCLASAWLSVSRAIFMNNKSAITLWSESVQWFPHCLPGSIRYKFLYNLSPRSLPVAIPLPLSLSQSLNSHPCYSVDSEGPQPCPLACLCQCCSFFLEWLCPPLCQANSYLCFNTQLMSLLPWSPPLLPIFPPMLPKGCEWISTTTNSYMKVMNLYVYIRDSTRSSWDNLCVFGTLNFEK